MPIDASIPLQYRQPQFESPINKLAQVMQLQGMQDQQMERQVARDEQNRLKTLLASPTDDLGAALTRGGFLPQAQAYAKTQAEINREKREAEKATREGLKFDFDRTKGILSEVKNAVTALKSNPASTPEMAAQAALQIGQLFKMPEEQIRGMIAKIPQDPADFRRYLDDEEKSMLTAEQRLTLFAPKLQAVPRGNVTDIMDLSGLSPTSGRTMQSVEMGLTPGERRRSEDTRRGQNMVDARANEANNTPQYMETEGGIIALPKRGALGGPIVATPVMGADGKPLAGKGSKMTEDQGKATGWLIQADNAWKNMQAAMAKDPSVAQKGLPDALAAIPSMGFTGAVANTIRGAERQKFIQATESLSESLLRAATGAGVNQDEAAQKVRELTPVFGESAETTKQKMAAIPLYIESLKVRAGPGAKLAAGVSSGGAPSGASNIDALLKKYGQ